MSNVTIDVEYTIDLPHAAPHVQRKALQPVPLFSTQMKDDAPQKPYWENHCSYPFADGCEWEQARVILVGMA